VLSSIRSWIGFGELALAHIARQSARLDGARGV
jgi:hypothetical protein